MPKEEGTRKWRNVSTLWRILEICQVLMGIWCCRERKCNDQHWLLILLECKTITEAKNFTPSENSSTPTNTVGCPRLILFPAVPEWQHEQSLSLSFWQTFFSRTKRFVDDFINHKGWYFCWTANWQPLFRSPAYQSFMWKGPQMWTTRTWKAQAYCRRSLHRIKSQMSNCQSCYAFSFSQFRSSTFSSSICDFGTLVSIQVPLISLSFRWKAICSSGLIYFIRI